MGPWSTSSALGGPAQPSKTVSHPYRNRYGCDCRTALTTGPRGGPSDTREWYKLARKQCPTAIIGETESITIPALTWGNVEIRRRPSTRSLRGTSDTRRTRRSPGSGRCGASPPRTPRRPTPTSRPDCPSTAGDMGSPRRRVGSRHPPLRGARRTPLSEQVRDQPRADRGGALRDRRPHPLPRRPGSARTGSRTG